MIDVRPHRASFLFDNADVRVMNIGGMPLGEAIQTGQRCLANGDNAIYIYSANAGDGSPAVTSMYRDNVHGGVLDPGKLGNLKGVFREASKHFEQVWVWLYPDDSPAVTGAPIPNQIRYVSDVVEHLLPHCYGVCAGLELNEYTGGDQVTPGLDRDLVQLLKRMTDKPVGVHYHRLTYWKRALATGADLLFGQYETRDQTPEKIEAETRAVTTHLRGRMAFVANEYHRSSDTAEAKALGRAVMRVAECQGTGTGR